MSVVETRYGKVRGAQIADGVQGWRGIPYASPPVGELRLRPPSPPRAWSGVRDAVQYGDRAPQPEPLPEPGAPPMAEDCLYLNVTAPAVTSGRPRPVLFWIHGGGFEMGQGPDHAEDGAAFARSHGLVVVSFNYRLGALGFLDVPGEQPTGAFGLHDQIAALRWTRENIAAFGGDPDQITVYGLSAGGKSVTSLLASPLAAGRLVARAAESSGGDHVKSREQAAALTERFLRELGSTADRLRAAGVADILAAQAAIATPPRSTWIWRPSVDGVALTASPLTAIAGGAAAGVPLLLQTCARETALYQLLGPDAAEQTDGVLAGYFGAALSAAALLGQRYAAAYLTSTRPRCASRSCPTSGTWPRAPSCSPTRRPLTATSGGPATTAPTPASTTTPRSPSSRPCLPARTAATAKPSGWAARARQARCTRPGVRSRPPATPAGPATPPRAAIPR